MDTVKDSHMEAKPPAITSLGGSLTSSVEVNTSQKKKKARKKKKQGKAVEHKDKCPDSSLDNSSLKTDATIKDPLHESPALPNSHMEVEPPAITSLGGSLTSTVGANSSQKKKRARKKKKQGKAVEHKDKCPDSSLDNSSLKIDATIKDPLHVSPALPSLLSCQRIVELNSTKKNKKRKRQKTKHKAIESNVNDRGAPKTSTPALDMPSEHPIQYVSTNPLTRQSCVERDICQEENEEKVQNILKKTAENSNGECDIQKVSCARNSVVANAQCLVKESVLEVVKLNIEQGINDSSSNPEDKSGFVKNESLAKQCDDYPALYQFSKKFKHVKTYERRKGVKFNYERNSSYEGRVNSNKEPTMQDDYRDDSHKFSDRLLTVGLMEKETKPLEDQVTSHSGAATTEMKLMTENMSEQRVVTTSSAVDIHVVQLEETNDRLLDHTEITRNDLCCAGDAAELSLVSVKDDHSKISHFSLDRTITSNSKKKLLVLDVNGLLADFVSYVPKGYKPQPDLRLQRRQVYKRPFCDDFLRFCFDNFHVGIWSSRAKYNVDKVIQLFMGESASKLLFCWNQSHCTKTKFTTVENQTKPLVLKELTKLWEKLVPGLPWEKGEFNESNTLLLDDSPYKALANPMYTAIFPYSYEYNDTRDASLGPGGDLRVYLEGLAIAENVQEYVSSNPFGQRPITESNPSWGYYRKVIRAVKQRRQNAA